MIGTRLFLDTYEEFFVADRVSVELMLEALKTLPSGEEAVLRYRYGLDGAEPKTKKETAARFGVTPQTIANRVNKAQRRLRHPSRSRAIRTYQRSTYKDIDKITRWRS